VRVGLGGTGYEIDLSTKNASAGNLLRQLRGEFTG
jgi:hypothetical protein